MFSYKKLIDNLYCECPYIIDLSDIDMFNNLIHTTCQLNSEYKVYVHDVTEYGIELSLMPVYRNVDDYITDMGIIIDIDSDEYMSNGLNKSQIKRDFVYEIERIVKDRLTEIDKMIFIENCLNNVDDFYDYFTEVEDEDKEYNVSYLDNFKFQLTNYENLEDVILIDLSDSIDDMFELCLDNDISDITYIIKNKLKG